MAGKFLKGALVQFSEAFGLPVPNVILFQYNPETITHSWKPAIGQSAAEPGKGSNPQAIFGNPGESFSFTLQLDANDQIAQYNPLAMSSGIYSRIAALEMLLFPAASFKAALEGSVSAAQSAGGGTDEQSAAAEQARAVPASAVPTVLFVWGPGRILPVRVTELFFVEKLFNEALIPIHAEAQIRLDVLTPDDLATAKRAKDPLAEVGEGAYKYTHGARQALSIANLANSVESIIGMLPV